MKIDQMLTAESDHVTFETFNGVWLNNVRAGHMVPFEEFETFLKGARVEPSFVKVSVDSHNFIWAVLGTMFGNLIMGGRSNSRLKVSFPVELGSIVRRQQFYQEDIVMIFGDGNRSDNLNATLMRIIANGSRIIKE